LRNRLYDSVFGGNSQPIFPIFMTASVRLVTLSAKMAGLLLLAMVPADAASAQTDYPNNPVRLIPGQAAPSTSLCASSPMG
jgi:hypothetical protein